MVGIARAVAVAAAAATEEPREQTAALAASRFGLAFAARVPRRAVAVHRRVRTVIVPVVTAGIARVRTLGADADPTTILGFARGAFAVVSHSEPPLLLGFRRLIGGPPNNHSPITTG